MIEKVLASVKKETDRQYFFARLKNPLWIEPLHERGYFSNPPGMKHLPGGYVQYPHWPEMAYLVNVAEKSADKTIGIVLAQPETDNPRVYDDILEIALKLKGKESARLLPKLVEYTELNNQFLAYRYPELLQHWIIQRNFNEALEIIKKLVMFREDLRAREKQELRKNNPNALGTLLEPAPLFHQWEYQQILEKGVRPLAEHEPYKVARILIDAVEKMIPLRMHPEDFEKVGDQDCSEIWCRRLDKPDREYQDVKETLVQALTFACEQVYDIAPEFVDALDQVLRKPRWRLFNRLRQHLYASHLNDQTLPWIREQILDHDDYSKWDHHYEFQLMIRKASDFFGSRLLSEEERECIFNTILSGPSKEDFREWLGERYSEEVFQQRQRYFHRIQLRPFAALLNGSVQQYYEKLEGEGQSESITDESYSPYSVDRGGFISHRSPKSIEELNGFTDEELLTYLNDWNAEHQDKDNWLVKISISALAEVFYSLFKERIVPDGTRRAFWLANRDRIARPVYVASMLKAMLEIVKGKNFDNLDQWIEFCAWVLSHPDTVRVEGQLDPREVSRDHPDWGSSRRAVVDFVDACVNKDMDAPIAARGGLAALLRQVCSQSDWRLDHNHPVLLNRDDPLTEAINNTRSRALESLINFGVWILRQLPEEQLSEVTDILTERIAENAEIPLTRPEQALLGMHFGNLCTFNRDWAAQKRKIFFPQTNEAVWRAAFGSYICFNRPDKLMFEILRGEFEYAIANLDILASENGDGEGLIDSLGQHLFSYYLWEFYPLTGDESLLERFYDKTNNDRKRWAQLFDHVGRSLRNSGKRLGKELIDRSIKYFDWRYEAAEHLELQEFTFWLEAECLDTEWRLRSYSKVLDLVKDGVLNPMKTFFMEVKILNKLHADHLSLVVECFAKITDAIDQSTQIYISADETKPILISGLNSAYSPDRNNAERAIENLLRLGRFDYLDVE